MILGKARVKAKKTAPKARAALELAAIDTREASLPDMTEALAFPNGSRMLRKLRRQMDRPPMKAAAST